MAGSFESANSTRIINDAALITGYPCTVAAWFYPTVGTSTRSIWSISDPNVASNHGLRMGVLGASSTWVYSAGDGTNTNSSFGTMTLNAWAFMLVRFIAADNRRASVIEYNGVIVHSQNVTSRIPSNATRMALGCRFSTAVADLFDGRIGEFWYTDTDIQPDAAELQNSTLRQLAFGGPFSIPHVGKDVVEYRGLRVSPTIDELGEVYYGKYGKQTWTNVGGVTTGPHPPLPYWFVKPDQTLRQLVI